MVRRPRLPAVLVAGGLACTAAGVLAASPLVAQAGVSSWDFGVTKTHTGSFVAGGSGGSWVISLVAGSNTTGSLYFGPGEPALHVVDPMPPGASFISANGSPSGWTCSSEVTTGTTTTGTSTSTTTSTKTGVVGCDYSPTTTETATPGSTTYGVTLHVSVASSEGGNTLSNTATYTPRGFVDSNTTNNTATDTVSVAAATTAVTSSSSSPSTTSTAAVAGVPATGAGTHDTLALVLLLTGLGGIGAGLTVRRR